MALNPNSIFKTKYIYKLFIIFFSCIFKNHEDIWINPKHHKNHTAFGRIAQSGKNIFLFLFALNKINK